MCFIGTASSIPALHAGDSCLGCATASNIIRLWCGELQDQLIALRLMRGNKRPFRVLRDVSGVLKPVSSLHFT